MTQDEIIEMVRQVATQASKVGPYRTWTHEYAMSLIMQLIEASAAAEREACADVVDSVAKQDGLTKEQRLALHVAADAIRARGQTS